MFAICLKEMHYYNRSFLRCLGAMESKAPVPFLLLLLLTADRVMGLRRSFLSVLS